MFSIGSVKYGTASPLQLYVPRRDEGGYQRDNHGRLKGPWEPAMAGVIAVKPIPRSGKEPLFEVMDGGNRVDLARACGVSEVAVMILPAETDGADGLLSLNDPSIRKQLSPTDRYFAGLKADDDNEAKKFASVLRKATDWLEDDGFEVDFRVVKSSAPDTLWHAVGRGMELLRAGTSLHDMTTALSEYFQVDGVDSPISSNMLEVLTYIASQNHKKPIYKMLQDAMKQYGYSSPAGLEKLANQRRGSMGSSASKQVRFYLLEVIKGKGKDSVRISNPYPVK